MDFTLKAYKSLICALKEARYAFLTFDEFLSEGQDWKCVVLRSEEHTSELQSLSAYRSGGRGLFNILFQGSAGELE